MLMVLTISLFKEINIFPSIVDHAGPSLQLVVSAIELKYLEKLNSLTLLLVHKFCFHAKQEMLDVTEVILVLLSNGFIKIILLTKLAHLIKLLDILPDYHALVKSNAKIVCQEKDVLPNKTLKFMELINMVIYQVNIK